MAMTSRERVLTALNHEEPDRVPIILGANNTTGMKVKPYRKLKEHWNIRSDDLYLYDWPELGSVLMDDDALDRLHSDVRGVLDRFPASTYERNLGRPPHSPYLNDWGCRSGEVEPGTYFQSDYPLKGASTLDDIEAYPFWPDMDDHYRVSHIREAARALAQANRYAILGSPWLLSIFERAQAMQGMDTLLVNMSANPELAQALFEKIAALCKTLMGHFLSECGEHLDIICIGDDLGTERSLMISPRMYRRLLKPLHADFIAFIKSRTKAKVFFHTDGDVFDLIDDLVEIGVEVLNPIQTSAGKMSNLAELKKRYGMNLAFCGAIDTQRILPFGSPDEVRTEVRRVIDLLGRDGGYLLGAVHTIMSEVPAANIIAMVEAVQEFGGHRHGS